MSDLNLFVNKDHGILKILWLESYWLGIYMSSSPEQCMRTNALSGLIWANSVARIECDVRYKIISCLWSLEWKLQFGRISYTDQLDDEKMA